MGEGEKLAVRLIIGTQILCFREARLGTEGLEMELSEGNQCSSGHLHSNIPILPAAQEEEKRNKRNDSNKAKSKRGRGTSRATRRMETRRPSHEP